MVTYCSDQPRTQLFAACWYPHLWESLLWARSYPSAAVIHGHHAERGNLGRKTNRPPWSLSIWCLLQSTEDLVYNIYQLCHCLVKVEPSAAGLKGHPIFGGQRPVRAGCHGQLGSFNHHGVPSVARAASCVSDQLRVRSCRRKIFECPPSEVATENPSCVFEMALHRPQASILHYPCLSYPGGMRDTSLSTVLVVAPPRAGLRRLALGGKSTGARGVEAIHMRWHTSADKSFLACSNGVAQLLHGKRKSLTERLEYGRQSCVMDKRWCSLARRHWRRLAPVGALAAKKYAD